MANLADIQSEIEKIKARNERVEKDKAWETSWVRRISIAVSTYILITIFLIIIKVEKPLLSAIIPAAAYLISTATLVILKNWWTKQIAK